MLTDRRHAVNELKEYQSILVVGKADIIAVAVFQGKARSWSAWGESLQLREKVADDAFVFGVFGLRLDVAQMVLGEAARVTVAVAELL